MKRLSTRGRKKKKEKRKEKRTASSSARAPPERRQVPSRRHRHAPGPRLVGHSLGEKHPQRKQAAVSFAAVAVVAADADASSSSLSSSSSSPGKDRGRRRPAQRSRGRGQGRQRRRREQRLRRAQRRRRRRDREVVDEHEPLVAAQQPVAAALEALDCGGGGGRWRHCRCCCCWRCRCCRRGSAAVVAVGVDRARAPAACVAAASPRDRVRVVAVERVPAGHLELLVRLAHRLAVALGPPAVPVAAEVARRAPVEQKEAARRRRRARRRARDGKVVQPVVAEEVDDVLAAEPGPPRAREDVAEGLWGVARGVEALGGAGHAWSGSRKGKSLAAAATAAAVVKKTLAREMLKRWGKTRRALRSLEALGCTMRPRWELHK